MFGLLGFLPGYLISKLMQSRGMLRIPAAVELRGLDAMTNEGYENAIADVKAAEKAILNGQSK